MGVGHTCVIKSDGIVQCWGRNTSQQSNIPVNLIAKKISAGLMHTCAVKQNDVVQCWGKVSYSTPNGLTAKQL